MIGGIVKKTVIFFLITGFFVFAPVKTKANFLTGLSVSLANNKPLVENTHTISFSLGTTWNLRRVNIQYFKKDGDFVKPASLSFSHATAGSITGLSSEHWSINLLDSAAGMVHLENAEEVPAELQAGTAISFTVDNVNNPELGDCLSKSMVDTCMVSIETIDDIGNTIDSGKVSYNIEEDPSISFMVSGVETGTVTNGITTNITTDYNSINFGHLAILKPKFGAQKLTVVSNSPNGYEVKMRTEGYIEGLIPKNKIDPFGPTDVTWNEPSQWTNPSGGVCSEFICTDTGWIGANTSDTRIGGNWTRGAGLFGPVSTARHLVMKTGSRDTGTDVYVTYGIEVNQNQPPDMYAGTLIYEILAVY